MLKITNLTKNFSGLSRPVIQSLNLTIQPQEFCIVLGANGSGKSTLLNIIAGDMQPDAGSVVFYDKCIGLQRHKIASVVQDVNAGTVPEMTLLENLALGYARLTGERFRLSSSCRTFVFKTLKTVGLGLEKFMDQPLKSLSGGQRQVVATVMAVMSQPQLLLLDEHTSALDPKVQKILMDYTAKAIREQGMMGLMITHNMNDAIRYGNRLILLHKGSVVMDLDRDEKSKLSVQQLLDCFHTFEDKDLVVGGEK